jgi:hypothetical protein
VCISSAHICSFLGIFFLVSLLDLLTEFGHIAISLGLALSPLIILITMRVRLGHFRGARRLSLCEYRHGGDYQNGNNQLQVHEGPPAVCDDDVFTGRVDVAEIFLSASTPSHPKIQT